MKYPSRRIGGLRQAGAFANRSARGFCGMVKNRWIRLGWTERNGSDEIARHARGSGFPHGVLMSAKRLAGPRFPRYLTHVRTKEGLRTALRALFAKYQVKWGGKSCLAVEWAFRLLPAPGFRHQGLTRVQEIERMIPSGLLSNACRATVPDRPILRRLRRSRLSQARGKRLDRYGRRSMRTHAAASSGICRAMRQIESPDGNRSAGFLSAFPLLCVLRQETFKMHLAISQPARA